MKNGFVFKVKVTVTEFQFIQTDMTVSVICSELLIFWGDQLSLTVHVHKLKCLVKRLLCCIQGQGHSEGSELQWMFARTVNSDRSNLVWRCIIISQSIIQQYHFAMFKVKATIVSTRSSEILKLLQYSKLVWWYIITRQSKTPWKDFLDFTQGVRQRIWLGGLWTRLLPLLAIPVSKAGVNTGGKIVKKMWKEHCFCNEYTCLLNF